MRIGIFTDTYIPELNGVANSAFMLKQQLEALGNQVYVFTASNPEAKDDDPNVFRLNSTPCPLLKERRLAYDSFREWAPLIRSLNLDLIHTQTEFTVGHIGRRAAKWLQIPMVHTYHTIYEDYTHYLKIPGNARLKGLVRKFSRFCCDHANAVIVPTAKVRRLLLSYGVNTDVYVQPTGIDLTKFMRPDQEHVLAIRDSFGLTRRNHVMVSIGRLSQEKNLAEIITYMKEIRGSDPMARLLVVGDGPERENLEEQVKAEGLERIVFFTGAVPWDEIQDYYAAGDVFVCASTSETQGLTYDEALASGKPLLVREDPCLDGLLSRGKNGYSYQDEAEFLSAYEMLFDGGEFRQMEHAARESVKPLLAETFAENVEKIYDSLVYGTPITGERQKRYDQVDTIAG